MNKKILFTALGTLIALAISGIFLMQRLNAPSYTLAVAKRGDIVQEVSASGKVESPTQIDLRFKGSGKLVFLNARVGDKISEGKIKSAIKWSVTRRREYL